jgi:hypothetical protein
MKDTIKTVFTAIGIFLFGYFVTSFVSWGWSLNGKEFVGTRLFILWGFLISTLIYLIKKYGK